MSETEEKKFSKADIQQALENTYRDGLNVVIGVIIGYVLGMMF